MARPKAEITKQLETIAAKCGLSPKHLRTLHSEGMPLELDAALHWLNHRPAPDVDGDSAADLRRERIRLIRAQSEKAELELSIRRNEVVSRAEVSEMFSHCGHAIRASLLAVENDLIAKVSGKGLPEARAIARKELAVIMGLIHDSESVFWQNHPLGDN